jgi:thiamine biosynthesis lipoprotein
LNHCLTFLWSFDWIRIMQELVFRAMNSQIQVVVDSEQPAVDTALAQVPGWFADWEQCLSRFRRDSELSQLNGRQGQWVPVSETLFGVLVAACQAAAYSNGLVSPVLLNALEQAGYDRSFEQITTSSAPAPGLWPGSRQADWQALKLDPATQRVYLPSAARLDLGGIAKGWAAAQAAQRLAQYGPALVDAGGDIALCGPRANAEPWPIEVADPWHPDEQLALLQVQTGGVATSGRDYRRWQQGDVWQHHIVDPRSGQPAQSDVLCATVVASTIVLAETAAKTALILGSQRGLAWIESRAEIAALLVLEDGQILPSQRMEDYLWH